MPIPTPADWEANAQAAHDAALAYAEQTLSDLAVASSIVAQLQTEILPVAGVVLEDVAPVVGAAVAASPAGPAVGALTAAGITALGQGIAPAPTAPLTVLQQAAVAAGVSAATTAINQLPKKGT